MFETETKDIQQSIEEKIIAATIECIGKYGIENLTSRKIATEAGVNLAAINYYFRSKENLVAIAIKRTVTEGLTDIDELYGNPKENKFVTLKKYMLTKFMGICNYKSITRAHLYGPFMQEDYSGSFFDEFNAFMADLAKFMEEMLPEEYKHRAKLMAITLFSAILTTAMMPQIYKKMSGIDFSDEDKAREFVNFIIDRLYL